MASSANRIWSVIAADPARRDALASLLGVPLPVAQVLVNRGLANPREARRFMEAPLEDLSDPFALPDVAAAVARLRGAVERRERITVYGDYDADGVTATAILVRGLRALGAEVDDYIPHRLREGYGLNLAAVQGLADRGTQVLLTADCGIRSVDEIRAAGARGLAAIVLDHHEPGEALPPALAVVNPKRRDVAASFAGFCAAGLAFQLIRALRRALGAAPEVPLDLLDLAAVGTIADVVPLLADNRVLARHGLMRLSETPQVGLRALREAIGRGGPADAWEVGFLLAPRLNAAGRMGDAGLAVRLLLTEDETEARELAALLDRENRARREVGDQMLAEALAMIETAGGPDLAIVLASETWHPGVVGIVASRLVDRFHRPAVLLALAEGVARGSARSIPGFSLVEALESCRDLLVRYGGHHAAAGLTLEASALDHFRRRLVEVARATLRPEDLQPVIAVDAEIELGQVTPDLAHHLAALAPFGMDNPEPVFVTRGLRVLSSGLVGEGSHLQLGVTDGRAYADAIGFDLGDLSETLAFTGVPVDLAYTVAVDRWQGEERLRLEVVDLQTPGLDPEQVLADTQLLVQRLFARADEYLQWRGRVEDAEVIHTKVVGVTFGDRQAVVATVSPGAPLALVREPRNPHDPHALRVLTADGRDLGYLSARLAGRLAPAIDAGARYEVRALQVTGGAEGQSLGLNIVLERHDMVRERADAAVRRAALAAVAPDDLMRRLRLHLTDGRPPRREEQEILDALLQGQGAVAVLPEAGSRSRIAALAAAACAARHPAVIALPLAGLVEERVEVLGAPLRALGLRVRMAHGGLSASAWDRVWDAVAGGRVDVLIASAEALSRAEVQAQALRPRLLVVEVDDLGDACIDAARALRESVGAPAVLCLAPRADPAQAQRAAAGLGGPKTVVAGRARTNVRLVDRRGEGDRDRHIRDLLRKGERAVIYLATPREAVRLAAWLREAVPSPPAPIAYSHGGLPRRARAVLAQLLREGRLLALVAAGAAVDTADLRGIQHVVMASLPASRLRFAAQAAPPGPGRRLATVHLLFGRADLDEQRRVLAQRWPDRETLARAYRALRRLAEEQGTVLWPEPGVAAALGEALSGAPVRALEGCVEILVQCGVVLREPEDGQWRLTVPAAAPRRDLRESRWFAEGEREREALETTARWVLEAAPREMLDAIAGPAAPSSAPEGREPARPSG
ncbi:MAG: single-stranded-DNA-specific exonuclease RecJ [Armatimonadetes bacterium]|nr:single-stranded-DNA-specific exonuclease RecJ [Armatimonadota bacterium]